MSRKALLVMVADFLVIIGLLFIPAGTVGWLAGWVYIALLCGVTLLVVPMLARNDPELLKERMSSPIQRNQPLWDKVLLTWIIHERSLLLAKACATGVDWGGPRPGADGPS